MSRISNLSRLTPGSTLGTDTGEAWVRKSACLDVDPEIFYPNHGGDPTRPGSTFDQARAICSRCPVRDECLALAMKSEGKGMTGRFGMFGGLTPYERSSLARAT